MFRLGRLRVSTPLGCCEATGCSVQTEQKTHTDTTIPTQSRIESPMAVKLSERAAEEVKRFQTEHNFGDDMVLRIGIAAGGCSGFSYTLNFDDSFDEKADTKYDCHGVAVVVDKKSALYLDGTTVDWYESLEKQGFTFENPNAVKSCGCGSSFQA